MAGWRSKFTAVLGSAGGGTGTLAVEGIWPVGDPRWWAVSASFFLLALVINIPVMARWFGSIADQKGFSFSWFREPSPLIEIIADESEVTYRPFLRIALAVVLSNYSGSTVTIRKAAIDAVLRHRSGINARMESISFECAQIGGDLSKSPKIFSAKPDDDDIKGYLHFNSREVVTDTIRFFRGTVVLSNGRTERFRFRVVDTYSANIGQSPIALMNG